jgi:hypothetical protein
LAAAEGRVPDFFGAFFVAIVFSGEAAVQPRRLL